MPSFRKRIFDIESSSLQNTLPKSLRIRKMKNFEKKFFLKNIVSMMKYYFHVSSDFETPSL